MRRTFAVVRTLALPLALAGMLCLPAQAAQPQGIAFTDPAGDANLLNDQGLGLPVPGTSTAPASVASDDILRVGLKTLYHASRHKKTPYGISPTLTLADAPDTHTYYWIEAQVPDGCDRGKGDYVSIAYSATLGVPITVANCDSSAPPRP